MQKTRGIGTIVNIFTDSLLWDGGKSASVIVFDNKSILLKFDDSYHDDKHTYEHAVAVVRHRGITTQDFFEETKEEIFNLYCVPVEIFDSNNPFDISWWHGGGADIVGLYFLDSPPKNYQSGQN